MTKPLSFNDDYEIRLQQAMRKAWRMCEDEACVLAVYAVERGEIDPLFVSRLDIKLQIGEVMRLSNGVWVCAHCGGNCGQCGMTGLDWQRAFSIRPHHRRSQYGWSQTARPRSSSAITARTLCVKSICTPDRRCGMKTPLGKHSATIWYAFLGRVRIAMVIGRHDGTVSLSGRRRPHEYGSQKGMARSTQCRADDGLLSAPGGDGSNMQTWSR